MTEPNSRVTETNQTLECLSRNIDAMDAASEKIASGMRTLDEIAFQGSILALNAALSTACAEEERAGSAADTARVLVAV